MRILEILFAALVLYGFVMKSIEDDPYILGFAIIAAVLIMVVEFWERGNKKLKNRGRY